MASLYDLKPRFQALLRPLAGRLAGAGIGADAVTLAAAILSLLLGAAALAAAGTGAARLVLFLYVPVLLLRMALNALDGMIAREIAGPTRRGAFLNEIGDMISDAALYLPLALLLPAPPALVIAIVTLALIGEAAGIQAQAVSGVRRYDGPLGKSDRALAFGALALATAAGIPAPAPWMPWILAALIPLAALTIVNRVRRALG